MEQDKNQEKTSRKRAVLLWWNRTWPTLRAALTPANQKRFWRVLLAAAVSILLVVGLVCSTWKWWLTELVIRPVVEENVRVEQELPAQEVEVTPDLPPAQQVQNIALFGIDQEEGAVGRSDALLILSVDKTNNKIKLTSLDRDTLVPIDGHGEEKLTHAWAYGQGTLAVKTLNQSFGMNITDYVYVNFTEFVSAIDYLGGVTVDVTAAERDHMNLSYNAWRPYYGYYIDKVEGTGRINLKGAQALSYTRNRSDGTANRAARQREVLSAMLAKVKEQSVTQWPDTLGRMLQLCHTTLTADEILDLGMWVLEEAPTIESLSLPTAQMDVFSGVLDSQRGWVRVYDLDTATVVLHNFIYETDKALPQSTASSATTPTGAADTDQPTDQTPKTTKP